MNNSLKSIRDFRNNRSVYKDNEESTGLKPMAKKEPDEFEKKLKSLEIL
jgi:hypothetical protein